MIVGEMPIMPPFFFTFVGCGTESGIPGLVRSKGTVLGTLVIMEGGFFYILSIRPVMSLRLVYIYTL